MNGPRQSVVGFAVVKLAVAGMPFYLMRLNAKWKDISFIGGHVKDRDAGSLETTTRRELYEEVPSIRHYDKITLEQLTPRIQFGPVKSLSRHELVNYELQFFLVRLEQSPEAMVHMLGAKSKNVWVSQYDLLQSGRYRIAQLVYLLDRTYPGGLDKIPYSSSINLNFPVQSRDFGALYSNQLEFALK
jgi:hypothetical protein